MDELRRVERRYLALRAELGGEDRRRLLLAANAFDWDLIDNRPTLSVPFGADSAFKTIIELADYLLGLLPGSFSRLMAAWTGNLPAKHSGVSWQPVFQMLPSDSAEVRDTILSMPLTTQVQPIVHTRTGNVAGYSCSSTARIGTRDVEWAELSTWASQYQLRCALDRRCTRTHIRHLHQHGLLDADGDEHVVLPVDGHTLRRAEVCLTDLVDAVDRLGIAPSRLVILLDRPDDAMTMDRLRRVATEIRDCGLTLGVRSSATSFSEIEWILELTPSLVQLAPEVTRRDQTTSPLQDAALNSLSEIQSLPGHHLLATGVSSDAELRRARRHGADLAQGMMAFGAESLSLVD